MQCNKNRINGKARAMWHYALTALLCLFAALPATAQQRLVKGFVYEGDQEPVIGATVKVKGTNRGTMTDIDGNFEIQASPKETLQISYVGYKTVEVSAAQTQVTVALEADNEVLDEVIVVGYGTQKKATLTGAVSQVNNKELAVTKNENVVNMLSGKIPGLRISQKSSQPGAFDNAIDIRGMGTPLFVVDGVPRDQGYFSRMDPNEIESVSVLKDASASIYGARAANGVLLVTTKHGTEQEGKFDVTFSFNVGWQDFLYVPESNSPLTHMQLMNERGRNGSFGTTYFGGAYIPQYSVSTMAPYQDGTLKGTNWNDELFSNYEPQYNYNVSLNGGSNRVKYFFNLGYIKQNGSYKSGSLNYNRWNFRSNVDVTIVKGLKATVQVGGYTDETNQPMTDMWTVYKMAWTYPTTAQAWVNGDHSMPNLDNEFGSNTQNPVATTNSAFTGYRKNKGWNFNGSLALQWELPWVKGLSLRAYYNYDYSNGDNTTYKKQFSYYSQNPDGSINEFPMNQDSFLRRDSYPYTGNLMQLSANYANSFGDHNINAMVMWEESYQNSNGFYGKRDMLLDGEYLLYGETSNQEAGTNSLWDKSRRAVIGRLGYDYAGRYLLDFAFREDASSGFPTKSRWGFFPSVSVGWRISQEKFLESISDILTNLKIRASWGQMGDDWGRNYPPTFVGYELNQRKLGWVYNGVLVQGAAPTGVPNPYLTWAKATTINLGLDVDLWGKMLTGTFEIFQRKRTGLLANSAAVIPGEVGVGLPQENLESDKTFGWEISLTHSNRIGDWNYFVTGQISATKNRWDYKMHGTKGNSMDEWRDVNWPGRNKDQWWSVEEAGRYGNFHDIQYAALPPGIQTLPGDYYYKDWNNDGQINGDDSHPYATYNLPVFNYGFTIGGGWKGIDINTTWQGSAKIYAQYDEVFTEVGPFGGGATLERYTDRWHTQSISDDPWNPHTTWIEGYYPATGHSFNNWSTGIHNTSYLRLKTLEVGYTFPEKWMNHAGIKQLRIYFNAYNLLTFSGLKGMDPERPGKNGGTGDGGILFYNYPVNRTFNIGASLKF